MLNPEQLDFIRSHSKDDDSFDALVAFFNTESPSTSARNHSAEPFNLPTMAVRDLFNMVATALIIIDDAGKILSLNVAAEHLTGYKGSEIEGNFLWEVFGDSDTYDSFLQTIESFAEGAIEKPITQTNVWQIQNGETRTITWTAMTSFVLENELKYVAITARDTTEQVRVERALYESENRFRQLIMFMNEGLGIQDENGELVFANQKLCEMLGYREHQLVGKPLDEFLTPAGKVIHDSEVQRRRNGESSAYELEWQRKDGSSLWTIVSGDPIFGDDGNFQGSFGVVTDITERREAERILRASEERYRQLVELSPETIIVHQNFVVQFLNEAAAQLLGIENREALIGTSLWDRIHPDFRSIVEERMVEVELMQQSVDMMEQQWLRLDGEIIDVEARSVPIEFDGQPMVQVIARDVAERKIAQRTVEQSEQRLRAITSTLGQGVYVLDQNGRLSFMNPEAERLLGWTEADLLGKEAHEIFHYIVDDQETDYPVMEVLHDQGAYRVDDDVFVHRDGSLMPVSYIVTPLVVNGEITGSVTGFTDNTERKKAELEREQLIRDLDSFAGTVAHDLKAPVNMIVGYADVIRQLGSDLSLENIQSYLNIIIKNTRKMTTVIDEILLLAGVRGSDPTLMEIDMRRVVHEARQRVEHFIDDFESEIIVAEDWPSVVGHGPWIEEAWANYLTNAHKYGGDPPRVELGWTDQGDGFIRFWVKDNGKGLTEAEQKQLFNPFVRLDQIRAKGHGLGLSIVRRIMEKLGGTVGVESEVGSGSIFYFTLPLAE